MPWGIDTGGSFLYQYGYLEVKYTVNLTRPNPFYHNYAFVVGHAGVPGVREYEHIACP